MKCAIAGEEETFVEIGVTHLPHRVQQGGREL